METFQIADNKQLKRALFLRLFRFLKNQWRILTVFSMDQSKKEFSPNKRLGVGRSRQWVMALMIIAVAFSVWSFFLFLGKLGPGKVDFHSSRRPESAENGIGEAMEDYKKMSAEDMKRMSVRLEMEAHSLLDAGDYVAAAVKYEQAAELQKAINRGHPSSAEKDVSRALHLRLEAKNAAAEPLFLESIRLEKRADFLIEEGDLTAALEILRQAMAVQQQLNDEHRGARQASGLRFRELQGKLAELKSREKYAAIEKALKRATSMRDKGEMKEAGELFGQAALLQQQLNKEYPESPYASMVKVSEFQREKQIVQSALLARKIKEKSALLEQMLAVREIGAVEPLLVELKEALWTFEEAYPLSSLIDGRLRDKLNYLYQKRSEFAVIQDQVYNSLLPVPETENVRMLQTEVPQSLYLLLIDKNPSRNPGGLRPVDSISWIEAREFCDRLSWILGKKVRLPTEAEFRQGLGNFNPADADDFIWSVLEAKGLSQPVGRKKPFPSGFFDLLGNVSEWLALEETAEAATVFNIGGHVQDSVGIIAGVPVRSSNKNARNRLTGFRVVVID